MASWINLEKLDNFFLICMAIGFVIPLFNLITGAFGSAFDLDLDFDFDLDLDGALDGLVPVNLSALCVPLVVFGAFGKYALRFMTQTWIVIAILLVLLVVSAASYILFYRLVIHKLKSNAHYALTDAQLIGQEGKIILRVRPDSAGTISLANAVGSVITYPARIDDRADFDGILEQGDIALVTRVEEHTCYVLPLIYGVRK